MLSRLGKFLPILPLEKVQVGPRQGKARREARSPEEWEGYLCHAPSVLWHLPKFHSASCRGFTGFASLTYKTRTAHGLWPGDTCLDATGFSGRLLVLWVSDARNTQVQTWTSQPPQVVDTWVPLSQRVSPPWVMGKAGVGCACDFVQMPLVILSQISYIPGQGTAGTTTSCQPRFSMWKLKR